MESPFQLEDEKKLTQETKPEPVQPAQPELAQHPEEPAPIAKPQEDFWAWFDAQIEQAHDELNVFQAGLSDQKSSEVPAAATPTAAPTATHEQPAQGESGMWKYLIIAAGALLALALAAPFIRKLLGRQDDDSGWYRRGSSLPKPPVEGSGGAVAEPSENSNETAKPRVQDIAAMALGKW